MMTEIDCARMRAHISNISRYQGLLKATHRANNDIMRIDDKDAEEVEQDRERVRRP